MSKLMDRRQMLARLGLAVGVAYIAPTMLTLSEARASGGSAGSNSGASAASPASAASTASAGSAPSRASGASFSRASSTSSASGPEDLRCRLSFSDGRMRRVGNCPPVEGNPFARLLRSNS